MLTVLKPLTPSRRNRLKNSSWFRSTSPFWAGKTKIRPPCNLNILRGKISWDNTAVPQPWDHLELLPFSLSLFTTDRSVSYPASDVTNMPKLNIPDADKRMQNVLRYLTSELLTLVCWEYECPIVAWCSNWLQRGPLNLEIAWHILYFYYITYIL